MTKALALLAGQQEEQEREGQRRITPEEKPLITCITAVDSCRTSAQQRLSEGTLTGGGFFAALSEEPPPHSAPAAFAAGGQLRLPCPPRLSFGTVLTIDTLLFTVTDRAVKLSCIPGQQSPICDSTETTALAINVTGPTHRLSLVL